MVKDKDKNHTFTSYTYQETNRSACQQTRAVCWKTHQALEAEAKPQEAKPQAGDQRKALQTHRL